MLPPRAEEMTAEIAILNKTAVALATDSAVTISAGSEKEKIYDSANKLFELSFQNPIGAMIYNGMNFMEIPLQDIICDFRKRGEQFDHLSSAATRFLEYLGDIEKGCSKNVKERSLYRNLSPILRIMKDRISDKIDDIITRGEEPQNIPDEVRKAYENTVDVFNKIYEDRSRATFIGGAPKMTKNRVAEIEKIAKEFFNPSDNELWPKIIQICKNIILKKPAFGSQTGIVFAGFGDSDIFPTLASYEIDGILFGKLKYTETNAIDIDRDGDRAKVIPFAQKEMVERFLYGLDGAIERKVSKFCKSTVPQISEEILNSLDLSEEDEIDLRERAKAAESDFFETLERSAFEEIRSESRRAVEDMVEFMPKPELATMAEALVNLTSLKRRVSRGMETVGGPIDVAVISRAEGFIWAKRKHYFSAELNPRYIRRAQSEAKNGAKNGPATS